MDRNRGRHLKFIQVYDKPGAIKLCQTGLVPEPAKESREAAKLDLLTLEPGVQSTVDHRGRRIRCHKARVPRR